MTVVEYECYVVMTIPTCSVVWWREKGKAEVRNGKGIALGV